MREEKQRGRIDLITVEWSMDRIMVHHQEHGRFRLQNQKNLKKKLTRSLCHIQKKFVLAGVAMEEVKSGVPVAVVAVMLTVHHVVVALNLMVNAVVDVAVDDSGAPHAVEMAWGGVLLVKEVADFVIIYC